MHAIEVVTGPIRGDNWPLRVELVGPLEDYKYGVRLDDDMATEWQRLHRVDPRNTTDWKPAITKPRHLPYARFRAPCGVFAEGFNSAELVALRDAADGLSIKETAKLNGVDPPSIKRARERAIRRLSAASIKDAAMKGAVLGLYTMDPDIHFRPVLTCRELHMQALHALDFSPAAIGDFLGIQPRTVRHILSTSRRRLWPWPEEIGIANAARTAKRCFELGLFVVGSCYDPKSIYGS